jgi:hypothetical protein
MKLDEINELRAMLPTGRTLFSYARHQYGLQLLRYAAPAPTPITALRQSAAAPLLQKPAVRSALSQCGKQLRASLLDMQIASLPAREHYALALDVWDGGIQISRPGANLVLQLNFSHQHNRAFERLLKPEPGWDFNGWGHPVLRGDAAGRRYTLAWARLDIDFDNGEALIEEIQTDWVRRARNAYTCAKSGVKQSYWHRHMGAMTHFVEYYESCLANHIAHWDEAMLTATLFFLREELGLRNIWTHTPQSGLLLKKMDARYAPPVSLYSDLPQRFCFRATESLPRFLAQDGRIIKRLRRAPETRLQKFAL